ncbi:MAG: diadenylate cyclase CdaA [Oscillospiraceae bacterium]|jgi:diadenylate cyclase
MDIIASYLKNIFETISKYSQTIRVTDVIDVAVVAFLCYKLLRLIRRTNTGRVIRAVLLFLAIIILSSFFKLNVVSFLMGRILEVGLLALVIVFQPELRRLLEQVGSSSISGIFRLDNSPQALDAAITQAVIAAAELSKAREGALLVFERRIKLDDIIKTGTVIESEVSSELLRNIFYPKAPLHDGAAIIRNARIAAAGCVLPLSGNANLSRDLGMRHRAGIGISEHSDAVAVIVSEETGAISVAVGGMLKRRLTPDTLERLLYNELHTENTDEAAKKGLGLANIFRVKKNDKKEGK